MPAPKDPIKYKEFVKKISGKNHHNYGNSRSKKVKRKISKGCKKNGIGKWMIGKHNSSKTEFKKGMIVSKKIRRRMSKSRKGHVVSKETRRKIGESNAIALKGNIVSLKTRRKLSEALKGEKSGNWKGGISSNNSKIRGSIEIRLWREAVFARDNWTCQKTGIKGGRLHSHHIHNFADFPEMRTSVENGITLLEKTHKEFHKKYGIKNNTKEQLKEFLVG